MRIAAIAVALVVSAALVTGRQAAHDATRMARLERLFPTATAFSPKGGAPPHIKAYADDAGGDRRLAGYAFLTRDLEPLERGYDGPIQILVGIDTTGSLTGVVVVDHNEPYGYFSIELPEFAAQFEAKSIRDRFRVGRDVDAVSRATMTVTSASRAVRNSARRIARQFLTPPVDSK